MFVRVAIQRYTRQWLSDAKKRPPFDATDPHPRPRMPVEYGDVAVSFAGTSTGTVSLICESYQAPTIYNAVLTATKVGSVTTS